MSLRSIGFGQADFMELTLPELYHRYCIEVKRIREDQRKR
jgi:hypothetical protein